MTTRGLNESDFEKIAEFIDHGVKLTIDIKKKVTGKSKKIIVSFNYVSFL
jgi:hypothetical protein